MKKKESFVLHHSLRTIMRKLKDDQQRAQLIMAILDYECDGTISNFSSEAVEMAFEMVRDQLDRDRNRYLAICQKRSHIGKIGGIASVASRMADKSDQNNHTQPNPTNCLDNQPIDSKTESPPPSPSGFSLECENKSTTCFSFEEFWNIYDRKIERKKCEKIYAKIPETTRAIIKEKLPSYIKSTPEVKYRKHPQTWLNNECWNDDVPCPNINERNHMRI